MSFLDPNYKVPTSGGSYMKFEQGKNKFRILSNSIIGYEYWTTEKKPVRAKELWTEQPADIKLQGDQTWQQAIKHFWAFAVWNYQTNQVEILEVTQKTIQTAIKALADNEKWGHPNKYDLEITKEGDGMETKYQVISEPPTEISAEIKAAYEAKPVNLEALYVSGDPFAKEVTDLPFG